MCENIRVPPPPLGTPLTQGLGSKGQNSTFSEHGPFAYQIKGNHEMQQHSRNILPADPSPSSRHDLWGLKVKVQLVQNMAMLHIKFKGITNYTNIVAKYFARRPPPIPPPPPYTSLGKFNLFRTWPYVTSCT